jgi:hypothetical protein
MNIWLIYKIIFNVDNIKALGAWAGIQGKPNQITNEEIANGNINDIRFFSPNDVKAIVLTNAISTSPSQLINPVVAKSVFETNTFT